jgi:hypothetical protein
MVVCLLLLLCAGEAVINDENDFTGNCELNGKSSMQWKDGTTYSGDCVNNKAHGRGYYIYSNRDSYRGDWVDGKRHGIGEYKYANGDLYDGHWEHDKPLGHGKVYFAKNNQGYEGNFGKGFKFGNKAKHHW